MDDHWFANAYKSQLTLSYHATVRHGPVGQTGCIRGLGATRSSSFQGRRQLDGAHGCSASHQVWPQCGKAGPPRRVDRRRRPRLPGAREPGGAGVPLCGNRSLSSRCGRRHRRVAGRCAGSAAGESAGGGDFRGRVRAAARSGAGCWCICTSYGCLGLYPSGLGTSVYDGYRDLGAHLPLGAPGSPFTSFVDSGRAPVRLTV